jgi:hypothetical protein
MGTANREQLESEIIDRSESGTWDEAKLEWDLERIYDDDERGRCLCGQYPIKEKCVLKNNINEKEVIVGNVCVRQFMGLPSDWIFKSLKKIKINPDASLNKETLEFMHGKGYMDDWQYDFSMDTLNQRCITERQMIQRRKIIEIFREKVISNRNVVHSLS